MRRIVLFFAFMVSFLYVLCFGWPVEAAQNLMSKNAEQALSLIGSMAKDPDAVDCVRRACLEVPYRNRSVRHARLEACKREHLRRLAAVMSGRSTALRSYGPGQTAPRPEDLECSAITGQPEPSEEEELDMAFRQRWATRLAESEANSHMEAGDTGESVTDNSVKTHQATPPEEAKSPPKSQTVYAGLTGPDEGHVAHCAPEHFVVRTSDKCSVKLYIEAGATYDSLARSCLAKRYRTDAVSVVEENYVEVTIPACILPGGKIELDPTRYSEILSGKRKLVMNGEPNLEFHKQCTAKGGKPWVALQGRQVLWLASKDVPPRVSPGQEQEISPEQPLVNNAARAQEAPAAVVDSPDAGNDVDHPEAGLAKSGETPPDASVTAEPDSMDCTVLTLHRIRIRFRRPRKPGRKRPTGLTGSRKACLTGHLHRLQTGMMSHSLNLGSEQKVGLQTAAFCPWPVQNIRRVIDLWRATSPPGHELNFGLRSGAGLPIYSERSPAKPVFPQ
jgi:hypothetical protein